MANLLELNEIFYSNFEPKQKHRFIMYIDGIPSYLIKKVGRPKINHEIVTLPHINVERYVKGKSKWSPVSCTLYDPVVPSGAQTVMEWVRLSHESVTGRNGYADFYKKDVTINVLGPVGDKVEEWTLKGAWVSGDVDFGDLDWSSTNAICEINFNICYDFAILQY